MNSEGFSLNKSWKPLIQTLKEQKKALLIWLSHTQALHWVSHHTLLIKVSYTSLLSHPVALLSWGFTYLPFGSHISLPLLLLAPTSRYRAFRPEGGGSRVLCSFCILPQCYMALHPRRPRPECCALFQELASKHFFIFNFRIMYLLWYLFSIVIVFLRWRVLMWHSTVGAAPYILNYP